MELEGKWKNVLTGELISLRNNHNGDEYTLEYYDDKNELCQEKIGIFITNESHAHLGGSKKFGVADIYSFGYPNRIKINDQAFEKE